MLKRTIALGAIIVGLALPVSAMADGTGAVGGAAVGAVGGAIVGGPVGAIVGGVGGAVVGSTVPNGPMMEGRAAYVEPRPYFVPNPNVAPSSPYAIMPVRQ